MKMGPSWGWLVRHHWTGSAVRTGPKATDRSEASIISRANDECDATKQPIVAVRCPLDKRTVVQST